MSAFTVNELDPGASLGPRYKPATDVWRRDFERATVTYTQATRTGTITTT